MTSETRLFPISVPHSVAERAVIGDLQLGQQMTLVCAIPWTLLAKHERRAKKTYGVGLEELASRGGLDAAEALAVIIGSDRPWIEANARLAQMLTVALLELTAA